MLGITDLEYALGLGYGYWGTGLLVLVKHRYTCGFMRLREHDCYPLRSGSEKERF